MCFLLPLTVALPKPRRRCRRRLPAYFGRDRDCRGSSLFSRGTPSHICREEPVATTLTPLIWLSGDGRQWRVLSRAQSRSGWPSNPHLTRVPQSLHVCAMLPHVYTCLLYTSDAADERSSVDLG